VVLIEAANVVKHYRMGEVVVEALRGVSLKIDQGDFAVIVGPSGSGKSTLMHILGALDHPTTGKVYMDGIDISELSLSSLRSHVGMVSQDVILFNETVRANIAYGKSGASEQEIINAAKAAFAHDFIMEFPDGYNTVVGERGVRLSGGQKQRLSIARAILKNPPVLILDEATSALDTESEMMVQKALENLMHDRTAFVIAHRLSTVRRADRIIVLENGRIAETGTHDELLSADGIYKNLHSFQFNNSITDETMA